MNNLTEEQKLRRRKKNKRAKVRRQITTAILVILLLIASGAAMYEYMLYRQALNTANENMQAYNELKSEVDNEEYITTEEADKLLNDAVDRTYAQTYESVRDEYLDQIRAYMENGETLTMLESLYTDNIVVPDTGGYRFFDIDASLKSGEIDPEKLSYPVRNEETGKYEGEVTYGSEDTVTKKGVDVSSFQGDIDWNKVKNDGVEFAYIRLGYRGYESGRIVNDNKYEDNIQGCNDAGLDCGVYFFSEALNEAEGIEEAEFILECLEGYHTELPIVIDVEQSANISKSRTKNLTSEGRTKAVTAFCERILEAGYTPMIYGNLKSMLIMLEFDELEAYDKWFAYYKYPLRFPYRIKIWQYTSAGTVDGIKGNADVNIMFY